MYQVKELDTSTNFLQCLHFSLQCEDDVRCKKAYVCAAVCQIS